MRSVVTMFFILVGLFFLSYCTQNKQNADNTGNTQEQTAQLTDQQLVERGEYLVNIMGCNDCHSPKQMGPQGPEIIKERLLSGFPADRPQLKPVKTALQQGWALISLDLTQATGPWGTSFAANLTPDASGIGNWTEDQFRKALKEGKFKGMENARTLLPPMPWQNFKDLKDEDLSAIFAYLKSIPPVQNVVPAPIPPQ